MAFTTGTATDWIDLANALQAYAATQGWEVLQFTPGDVVGGGMTMNLRGPGADVDKNVFVNIRTRHDDNNLQYCWDIRCAVAYLGTQPWGAQPGECTACFMPLWKQPIPYWFYVNDRRIVVVCKVGVRYFSFYAGFGLPPAIPTEYPFPLYCGATRADMSTADLTNNFMRSFMTTGGDTSGGISTGVSGAKVRLPDGNWLNIDSPYADSTSGWNRAGADAWVSPWSVGADTSGFEPAYNVWMASSTAGAVHSLVPTAQNDRLIIPGHVWKPTQPSYLMALDGVYFPSGGGLIPEQELVTTDRTFRVFQDVYRVASRDFFAVEEL